MNAVDQLCTNCGLCCDSTLFADVELRAGDDPKRLAALGLSLRKKGRVKIAFAQPCGCFEGGLCQIYGDRPKRCRLFECGLLQRVEAGEMGAGVALRKIFRAKALANEVRELLDSFRTDREAALSERYAQAMSEPVDFAKGNKDRHGELMQAYERLMRVLQAEFLRLEAHR